MENTLYYGDNLKILREHIPDNSVDLIYLDPPFNSKASYNILFKGPTGRPSEAQITAFEDTWHWTEEAEKTFQEIVEKAPAKAVKMMSAFRDFVGLNDVMAYLTMMCIRLIELRRVLKDTGSIYLHCDPTASHYLKILMDTVFGKENFRSEIVWCYTEREISKKYWNKKHDVIFFYTKKADDRHIFNWREVAIPYSPGTLEKFNYADKDGRRFQIRGKGGPYTGKQGLDISLEKTHPNWVYRDYLDKSPGVPPRDWWPIPVINRAARERLGYPTQKPETLLEKIIKASSDKGSIVLDPFCGCGTAMAVAQRLKRKWVGIDITHLAVNLIKWRLKNQFGLIPKKDYDVVGEPADFEGAKELAVQNRYQFQWWALSLIGARPYGDKKKGADTGIDGYIYFIDEKGKIKSAIVSVKSGKTSVKDIRDLCHIIEREKAEVGILMTLEKPTTPMKKEGIGKGYYESPSGEKYPQIQILTIEEVLKGKKPALPNKLEPFKRARRHIENQENLSML
ncbi:MAG: site-specific DNA-methyltransferase [candidate division Zixibacteria bacterium]|nr:site-specific DNA-methyltransferase [candidate division Zixibacteria bacterium]